MNRAYKIIISILIIICSILCMPFSFIKAESQLLAPPFLGVNINVIDVINNTRYVMRGSPEIENTNQMAWYCTARTSTGCDAWVTREPNGTTAKHNYEISFNGAYLNPTILNTNYIVELEFILDNEYVGQFQLEYNEINVGLVDQFVFINGSTVSIKLDNFNLSNPSISIYGINLKNNANHTWFYPIESFSVATFALNNLNLVGIDKYNNYYLPMFNLNNNSNIMEYYAQPEREYEFIFFISKNLYNLDTARNNFEISNGYIKKYKLINRFYGYNNQLNYIIKLTLDNNTDYGKSIIKWIGGSNYIYIPIYGGYTDVEFLSTDFALQFNLDNTLLKLIRKISDGTEQSLISVNNANSTNQQAQSTFEQEEQLINNQENYMQQKLNDLDISNKNNNLFGNAKFIASANWVRQQFNFFTNNNAFNYLITFSLVIGLALVIIGKLRS